MPLTIVYWDKGTCSNIQKNENQINLCVPVDVDLRLVIPALPGDTFRPRSTPTLEGD